VFDAVISIENQKTLLIGRLSTTFVEINGRRVARMRNGDKVDVPVSSGQLYVKLEGSQSGIELTVAPGDHVHLLITLTAIKVLPKP
jgi:hypothetical protein